MDIRQYTLSYRTVILHFAVWVVIVGGVGWLLQLRSMLSFLIGGIGGFESSIMLLSLDILLLAIVIALLLFKPKIGWATVLLFSVITLLNPYDISGTLAQGYTGFSPLGQIPALIMMLADGDLLFGANYLIGTLAYLALSLLAINQIKPLVSVLKEKLIAITFAIFIGLSELYQLVFVLEGRGTFSFASVLLPLVYWALLIWLQRAYPPTVSADN